jgi:hypothetical protein
MTAFGAYLGKITARSPDGPAPEHTYSVYVYGPDITIENIVTQKARRWNENTPDLDNNTPFRVTSCVMVGYAPTATGSRWFIIDPELPDLGECT